MAENNKPEFTDYKGPSGVGRDSVWLTNEDLPHDRDTPVTIERTVVARKVKFQGGREVAVVLALKFVGKDRVLRVNATIRKVLNALYTTNTDAWWGKPVLLFVEQDVRRPDGTAGPAVRIRAKRPEARAAATKPPAAGKDDAERANLLRELAEESVAGLVRRQAAVVGLEGEPSSWTIEQIRTVRDLVFASEPGAEG